MFGYCWLFGFQFGQWCLYVGCMWYGCDEDVLVVVNNDQVFCLFGMFFLQWGVDCFIIVLDVVLLQGGEQVGVEVGGQGLGIDDQVFFQFLVISDYQGE